MNELLEIANVLETVPEKRTGTRVEVGRARGMVTQTFPINMGIAMVNHPAPWPTSLVKEQV